MAKKLIAEKPLDAEPVFTDSASANAFTSDSPQKEPSFSLHRVIALAKRQMNRFGSLETKVLKNEKPGAIHDLRVASRRLQQTLDLLYPKPRAAKMRKIRRTVRRARRSLSAVRNTDVLLKKVEKRLDRKRLAHCEVWNAFREFLQDLRKDQIRKASRKLGKLNLTACYVHIKAALASAEGTTPKVISKSAAKPTPEPAVALVSGRTSELVPARNSRRNSAMTIKKPPQAHRPELRGLLAESLLNAWETLDERVAQSKKAPSVKTIHAVRNAGKKLRYLIEVMRTLRVTGSDPALAWLRQLQKHLGDWHDLEVMEQTMIEMVARPKFLGDHLELGVEAEKVVLRNRKLKQAYQDQFFELVDQKADLQSLQAWIRAFAERPAKPGQPPSETTDRSPAQPMETQAG